MALFLSRGFQATTVEDIAHAVEISPSTFFNYFSSKEAVVMEDELDPPILAAFNAQPAGVNPIGALRNAMRSVFSDLTPEQDLFMRQRMKLIASDPDLRAAMLNQFSGMVNQVAEVMAGRLRRKASEFAVRNLSGAVLGVLMAALLAAAEDPNTNLLADVDAAMAHLEAGLPLN